MTQLHYDFPEWYVGNIDCKCWFRIIMASAEWSRSGLVCQFRTSDFMFIGGTSFFPKHLISIIFYNESCDCFHGLRSYQDACIICCCLVLIRIDPFWSTFWNSSRAVDGWISDIICKNVFSCHFDVSSMFPITNPAYPSSTSTFSVSMGRLDWRSQWSVIFLHNFGTPHPESSISY
jgi:hypothetical protein